MANAERANAKGHRLLAVLAHPDDETFGSGGVLARYAAEGVRVAILCATRGEAGEISDPSLATRENLGEVREQELRSACDVLGVSDLFLLDYRDSGMAGSSDNSDPGALCRAGSRGVAEEVVRVIREFRPQVVLAFDPAGAYGHPDHVAMHHAAVEAFGAAGRATEHPEGANRPFSPSKLYYLAFPRSMARELQEAIKATGDESDFADMDAETMGVPDEEITTVIDIADYAQQKERAASCHRTQVGADPFGWLPESLRTRFLSAEYLVRVEPPFDRSGGNETDLFDGIES